MRKNVINKSKKRPVLAGRFFCDVKCLTDWVKCCNNKRQEGGFYMGMMRSKDDIEERMKGNGEMSDIKNLLDLIEEGLEKIDRDKEADKVTKP